MSSALPMQVSALIDPQALEGALFGAVPAGMPERFTQALIMRVLDAGEGISDLIFSPGRPAQVERHGELVAVEIPGLPMLLPVHTAQIARELIAGNRNALTTLRDQGACDLSYSIPNCSRFRVNVFKQRGSYAAVLRVIASKIPTLAELNLPAHLDDLTTLKNGIVLVTGPTGSGKSSTLAAVINLINERRAEHIITIEDPIEFLHPHKKATLHQRELHSDTPTFSLALRAALRQAPKVILVGEMRDRETIEIALTAAETGHLVFSTLHTIDASKTVERILGAFEPGDQPSVRSRLAASFRYIISQRLLPRQQGGRIAVLEILKATLRTREYLEKGDAEGKSLLDAMRDGELDGMQYFDGEMLKLVQQGIISATAAVQYASNPDNLRLELTQAQFAQGKPTHSKTSGMSQLEDIIVR